MQTVLALFAVGDVYVSIARKALTLHLARGEGRERYFGCNLMQRKVLASSYQHLMAEAPRHRRLRNLERLALATVFEYPGLDLERLSLAVSVPAVPAAAERLDVL